MRTPAKAQATRRVTKRAPHAKANSAARAPARPRTGGRSARVVTEVLSATLEEFAEQGYAGLSVEAVALRAGVNKTTIYRRWPTKADLVGAALVSLRDEDPEPPNTGSLRDDLHQVLQHWAAQMVTPRRRAIMQSLVLANTDPEMQAIVRRMRAERPAIPQVVFERALKRRELPKGSDTQLIASALLGPLHSRTAWKREPVDDAFVRALVELVLVGALGGGALSR
jgi:AcrR family transcriptional regulator